LIALRNGESLDLSAGYLLKLGLPAFSRGSNEAQDQAIPGLAELVVGHALCHEEERGIFLIRYQAESYTNNRCSWKLKLFERAGSFLFGLRICVGQTELG
jgi:hypothetical protein